MSPCCSQNEIEAVDPRGRTPLHLAVSLGHLESVRVLLRHGAEVTRENSMNWTGWSPEPMLRMLPSLPEMHGGRGSFPHSEAAVLLSSASAVGVSQVHTGIPLTAGERVPLGPCRHR